MCDARFIVIKMRVRVVFSFTSGLVTAGVALHLSTGAIPHRQTHQEQALCRNCMSISIKNKQKALDFIITAEHQGLAAGLVN